MKKTHTKLSFLFFILILLGTEEVFAQSTDFDRKLGAQNAQMVVAQMGIYEDEAKTEYVRKVGQRLVAELPEQIFDFEFHIVPEVSPNAFALPGGFVFITTGLLPIIQTEDELACIVAHEIIHAQNRHSVKQLKKSILPRLLEIPGNILGVVDENLGAIFNAPIQASNALLMASYGRSAETEADVEGIRLAAKAGYDPYAMKDVLARMSKSIETATGQSEKKSYFNDHPYTPDRLSTIDKKAKDIQWSKKPNSGEYLLEFDSLLFGESPAKGVISDNIFLHKDLDFRIEFPIGWDIANQPSNVGAYHPERKAALFLALDDPSMTVEEAAKSYQQGLEREDLAKMESAKPYELDGRQGYLMHFQERTEGVLMHAYVFWTKMDDKLFQLTGVTPFEFEEEIIQSVKTLRKLNDDEKDSFTINIMRTVQAEKGETIVELSERKENILIEDLTTVLNDINKETKLGKDQKIKIIKKYKY